jgi:methylated-DNA-protein-cysteine methyltransferase related protein
MNFPEKVIRLTEAIPVGRVVNYGGIAELLNEPGQARAVGYALNNLPYGSAVPWHRVVGKNGVYGKISLRSVSYGRDEQIARLKEEGIEFDANEQFPLLDYLWQPNPEEIEQIFASDE